MNSSEKVECVVCKKKTSLFNYGVHCCNACKMFFRRCQNPKTPILLCKFGGNCGSCRSCRYQICLKVGMRIPNHSPSSAPAPSLPENQKLGPIIESLRALDINRDYVYHNCKATKIWSLDDMLCSSKMDYEKKPESFRPEFSDWASINQIAVIEFIKRLDVMSNLPLGDSQLLVKSSYVKFLSITNTMRAYSTKNEETLYPDGSDVFPTEIKLFYKNCPNLLKKVICPLVAKFKYLDVTYEEFLLLGVIFICNPAIENVSESSRNTIAQHRLTYSNALIQYCLTTYQHAGPSRFHELLSLSCNAEKTIRDFGNIVIGYRSSKPKSRVFRLLNDFIDQIME